MNLKDALNHAMGPDGKGGSAQDGPFVGHPFISAAPLWLESNNLTFRARGSSMPIYRYPLPLDGWEKVEPEPAEGTAEWADKVGMEKPGTVVKPRNGSMDIARVYLNGKWGWADGCTTVTDRRPTASGITEWEIVSVPKPEPEPAEGSSAWADKVAMETPGTAVWPARCRYDYLARVYRDGRWFWADGGGRTCSPSVASDHAGLWVVSVPKPEPPKPTHKVVRREVDYRADAGIPTVRVPYPAGEQWQYLANALSLQPPFCLGGVAVLPSGEEVLGLSVAKIWADATGSWQQFRNKYFTISCVVKEVEFEVEEKT